MQLPLGECAAACRFVDDQDVLKTFERLRGDAYPWLLESSLENDPRGRFSLLGADPYWVLRVRGERIELECRRECRPGLQRGLHVLQGDPFEIVRSLMPSLPATLPSVAARFIGGAVGYFGYELAQVTEPVQFRAVDDLALPELVLLFVDRFVAFDHEQGRATAWGVGFGSDRGRAQERAERAAICQEQRLSQPLNRAWRPAARIEAAAVEARSGSTNLDEASYTEAVDTIHAEIAAGNVYQACLTRRIDLPFAGDSWQLYLALRETNPAPFACYLDFGDFAVAGSSPERFLQLGLDRRVESRPIKGTAPRGGDRRADDALRIALAESEKDRAENLMIVDLVRNDLGRVCEIGSVEVPELMAIEDYASVFQMVSTVTGILREECDVFDLMRATFPPGSMTGAPKIAALELLDRLEPVRRGVYSGAIGYLDARGNADLSVVIRTVVLKNGRAYVHTGGGIVADSQPAAEYLETLDKARPLLAALGLEQGRDG